MNVRRVVKWIGISIGGIVGFALLGTTIVYMVIGIDLSKSFEVPVTEVAVPIEYASTAEGQRLARTRGCLNGCHGDTVTGDVFFEMPDGTVLVAPDLATAAKKYSAAELERIIRHGVRPDGTSVLLPMPSEMFYNLSDEDVGLIIGFLQSQTSREEPLPQTYFGPLGRLMLLLFKQDMGTILAAESINHDLVRLDASPGDPEEYGKYIAMTSCTECHGPELRGWPDDNVPSLAIVAAYSLEDFTTLLRSGEPIGGRELDLMAEVAIRRFSNFTDSEIAALHAYLRTLVGSG
jgi:cytochrome c553